MELTQIVIIFAIIFLIYAIYAQTNMPVEQAVAETPLDISTTSLIVPGKYTLIPTSNKDMATIQKRSLPSQFTVDTDGTVYSAKTANVEFPSKGTMKVNGKMLDASSLEKTEYNSQKPHVSGYPFKYTREDLA